MGDREDHLNQYCVRAAPRRASPRAYLVLFTVAAAALLAGCGSDERSFSADEFVAEANRNGAHLELGVPLSTSDTGDELYALEVGSSDEPVKEQGLPEDHGELEHEHAGGSLRVSDSTEDAEAEYSRCEGAATLLCYRAANVVVILEEGAEPRDLRALETAIRAMESE
jgi:hypothetical protein